MKSQTLGVGANLIDGVSAIGQDKNKTEEDKVNEAKAAGGNLANARKDVN
jgi:hypothetical protein